MRDGRVFKPRAQGCRRRTTAETANLPSAGGPRLRPPICLARESQRLFGYGPNVNRKFCGSPKAWLRCGSSRTSRSRLMVSRSVRDRSETTRSTARNVNAGNMSLLRSNADCTAGERTRSRIRVTVAASGRLCTGGKFCRSKFCAALMALSITRSGFMKGTINPER
jgi:hypothetical protein